MNDEATNRIPSLSEYALLGRSGLRVSPLCLGTMTFGTDWGWGAPKETSNAILNAYLEAGGNFIDTANGYTNGSSESILGDFFSETKRRDEVVLATKFSFSTRPGDPNAGGNGRKHIYSALEASLRRLRTDYVDLYWLHAWDGLTPIEEVVGTMDALVRSGKVRYIGLSDTPAWYLARAETIAELRGMERVVALQLEYSLVERNIEHEHIPAALELGMGVCPWSPLASGLLTGKYARDGVRSKGEGRFATIQDSGNPAFTKLLTERNWRIVDTLVDVAREMGSTPASVALSWITRRPGVTSTIIGATKLDQLLANMRTLEVDIPPPLAAKLDEVSRPDDVFPYYFSEPVMRAMLTGATAVRAEPTWFRPA
jgi:aryl-alcohol dehydrogenase-like predicted oxidoreductase